MRCKHKYGKWSKDNSYLHKKYEHYVGDVVRVYEHYQTRECEKCGMLQKHTLRDK